MIKIDWKRFIEERIWFGYMRLWGYNSAKGKGWIPKWVKVK